METKNSGRGSADRRKSKYGSRRKQRRLRMLRIRAAVVFVLAAALVTVLLFVTPVFNIKSISVSGNNIVTLEQIESCIGDIVGQNLFSVWSSTIEKRLKTIAYIDEAEVSKALIPPTVYVNIRECEAAAYIEWDGKQVVVNSDLKVLDDSNTLSLDGVPLVRGIELSNYTVGGRLVIDDAEKLDALSIFLRTMSDIGELNGVLYLDLSSITDIKFNYNGTIDALCGSSLELDKKLRMFKAVMTSGSIKEGARGSIDLTNPEEAIWNY